MVRYNEFSVIADDGAQLRIRQTFPDDPASDAPSTFEVLGPRIGEVEPLPDGRYRVAGKVYTLLRRE